MAGIVPISYVRLVFVSPAVYDPAAAWLSIQIELTLPWARIN